MTPTPHSGILRTGAMAALALALLAGGADLASRLAFTTDSLQARADEAMRRAPRPIALEDQGEPIVAASLSTHP